MTTTAKIAAAYTTDSFGTAGTAKVTWTPTAGTNWSGYVTTDGILFVDQVKVYLWGSAADKTGEDPYKTMNTWYTTNKAAIDAASLASETQVGPWGLYMDLQLNIAATNLWPKVTQISATDCGVNIVNTAVLASAAAGSVLPVINDFGDTWGIGLVNKTTTAKTPFLAWSNVVTTAPTTTVNGVSAVSWDSYAWTPQTTTTDFGVAMTTANQTSLSGVAITSTAQQALADGAATFGTANPATKIAKTCDTTKWATATACEGVTKWAMNTGTAYSSSTSKGSKRAWLWLADANPTSKASVFGVEKDDVINMYMYQHNTWSSLTGVTACVLRSATADKSYRVNAHGIGTYTHAGASTTLLGASAVLAALVSFF